MRSRTQSSSALRRSRVERLATACLLIIALGGCQADSRDSAEELQPSDPSGEPSVERTQASDATDRPEQAQANPQPTRWQGLPIPANVRGGVAGFERPDKLLATLAAEFIDLSPGEGGDYARLRLHQNGQRLIGEILVDGLPDDSVAAYELRATIAEDDKGWHVAKLARRQLCRRGASGGACN